MKGCSSLRPSSRHVVERLLRTGARLGVRRRRIGDGLDRLNVHIAQLVQPEVVHGRGGGHEVALLEALVDRLARRVELVQDPLFDKRLVAAWLLVRRGLERRNGLELEQRKLGGVPQLVAELAVALDTQDVEVDVAACAGVGAQREAQRIGTALRDALGEVLLLTLGGLGDLLVVEVALLELGVQAVEVDALDDVDGVDDVAERLGHLASVGVAHHGVAEDLLEGQLAGEVDAEHAHPGDPEEEDVPAGLEQRGRVEVLDVVRLFGPAHDGEGPEAGAEPRVEHVLVLLERVALAAGELVGALLRLLERPADDPELVVAAVLRLALDVDKVDGAAMAPPELTRDAPVLDVLHPSEELLLGDVGSDGHLAGADALDDLGGERLAVDPPLRLHDGLDDVSGTRADGHGHGVVLGLNVAADLLELVDDSTTRREALHAGKVAAVFVEGTVVVEDVDELEVVALADLVIVGVVRRGDLDGTGSELHVDDDGVGDDGDLAAGDEGGGRRSCHGGASPVDEAVGAVDDAVLVELAEGLGDGLGAGLIHGEGLSGEVVGGAETAHLVGDARLIVVLPLEDLFEELFATVVVARLAFGLGEALFDDALGGDAGVVVAGVEERPVAVHSVPSDEGVLDGDGEGVADVEGAGDVRGRGGDDEGLFRVVRVGVGWLCRLKVVALLPPLVPALLYVERVVSVLHGLGEVLLLAGDGVVDPLGLLLDLLLGLLLLLFGAGACGVLGSLFALESILGGLLCELLCELCLLLEGALGHRLTVGAEGSIGRGQHQRRVPTQAAVAFRARRPWERTKT
ncbi:hypothetical protein L1887_42182 [Cichorium endivia]|nr:hypothetical protein L1887_42182 [Cichorium endivia]